MHRDKSGGLRFSRPQRIIASDCFGANLIAWSRNHLLMMLVECCSTINSFYTGYYEQVIRELASKGPHADFLLPCTSILLLLHVFFNYLDYTATFYLSIS